MPAKFVPPSIRSKSFSCPHCGAHADQTWCQLSIVDLAKTPLIFTEQDLDDLEALDPIDEEDRKKIGSRIALARKGATKRIFIDKADFITPSQTRLVNLWISICYSCKAIAVWHHDSIIYPHQRYAIEPNEDLNADIQKDFNEARSIVNLSPRGAAALLRLCIQKLCKQIGMPGKDINSDIATMAHQGLDSQIKESLDVVRVIGNEAVHPGELDLRDDRETAASLFELVNLIADRLISMPKKVKALHKRLPASKLKGIAERDARPKK